MARGRPTAIIVPVRGGEPKVRLSRMLTLPQRRQLQLAMLEDTLQVLMRTRTIGDAYVVSSNEGILEFAKRYGANGVLEPRDQGVNAAVETGVGRSSSYGRWLVIPADMPLLSPADLRTPLSLLRIGAQVVASPSRSYDGTNLLLFTRGARPELHYDDDSFTKHTRDTVGRGLRLAVYYSPGVAFDIDSPKDVHEFFKLAGGRGSATMTFLARTLRGKTVAATVRPKAR